MFALFPHCIKCGQRIDRFEDAEVRILQYRVAHRGSCPPPGAPPGRMPGQTP